MEAKIPLRPAVVFGLAAAFGGCPLALQAQEEDRSPESSVWQLNRLNTGFCVQMLLDSAILAQELPSAYRPVRADQAADLHPALRTVVENQPEYAAWTPSSLCMYFFEEVDAGRVRVANRNPRKAPMLGLWTAAAAADTGGAAADSAAAGGQDFVLEFLTNNGRLAGVARRDGLPFRETRSNVGKVTETDEDGRPSTDDRYQLKLGKALIIWDGRLASDSTPPASAIVRGWVVEGTSGGRLKGRMSLTADWQRGMIGSLKVQGDDRFARAFKASPIRFVGPLFRGGGGELRFTQ
ncbi:MAG: hypothetical protein ACREMX_13890 [Gemmatimonadales bacterium]